MKLSGRAFLNFAILEICSSLLSETMADGVATSTNVESPAKLSKTHFIRLLGGKGKNDDEWLKELEEACDITDKNELHDLKKFRNFFVNEFLDGNSEALMDDGSMPSAIDAFFNVFDTNKDGFIEFSEVQMLNLGVDINFSSMLALFRCIAGEEMRLTKGELRKAFVVGDPHFSTWQGAHFDYHGECDLVMIRNPKFDNSHGLDLHVRTEQLKPDGQYSYVSDVALRIGDDILEVKNDGSFYFNGSAEAVLPPTMGGGFPLAKKETNDKCFKIGENSHCSSVLIFSVEIGSHEEKIEIKAMKNMLHIDISGRSDNFEGSAGLMGTYGRKGHGRIARDGTTVLHDANEFAQEWQVRSDLNDAVLFHSARFPQYPQQCVPPSAIPYSVTQEGTPSLQQRELRNLRANSSGNKNEQPVLGDNARAACESHIDPMKNGEMFKYCVFDVMATGDLGHALVYGL
jgi:hypothetical protein